MYFGSTHILFIWKPFFEKNPTVPEPLGVAEDETLMTLLLFLMTLHFRAGLALSNQKTSGPINAHLTPSPGIYFNVFIHVYTSRAGADNPLGTNVDVNRNPLSLCAYCCKFYKVSF